MTNKYLCDTCGCDENHYEAIQRVRELHKPVPIRTRDICYTCDNFYPYPTIKALDSEK